MRFWNTIKIALRALRRSALRSVLTALGIIIGIAAVIAVVSIGNGAKSQVEASIASLGQNIITVFPGNFTSGGVRGGWGTASSLTVEDAVAIQREVDGIAAVSPEMRDRSQVMANGLNWNTQVLGEDVTYLGIRTWSIAEGEMFSEADVHGATKVCVIGASVVKQLFPDGEVIGRDIKIRNIPVKVVGVLAPKGFNFFGQDQDDVVIIPYTTHLRRFSRRPNLNSILIQAQSPDVIESVQKQVTELLQQRRQGREPDFTVRSQQELAEAATANAKTMTGLLVWIAVISLIVGGIGIMNIMLVSVTERTREIGIRLAVGAHGRDVLLQFLIEAVILSLLGGALGVLLGVGASEIISNRNGWPVLMATEWIFIAFGVSAAIGIAFGFFPAWKAAQLDPIDALRYE